MPYLQIRTYMFGNVDPLKPKVAMRTTPVFKKKIFSQMNIIFDAAFIDISSKYKPLSSTINWRR